MSDQQQRSTIQTAPGMATPHAQRVLDEARALLGQREQGGENRGPIVEKVCDPFLSDERLAAGLEKGILEWCAAFSCYCHWKVWPGIFPSAVSLQVGVLWERHAAKEWAFERGLWQPQPADFVYFVRVADGKPIFNDDKPALRHVGLLEEVTPDGYLKTIEGNSSDEVRRRKYHLSDPQVYGFSRVVPT